MRHVDFACRSLAPVAWSRFVQTLLTAWATCVLAVTPVGAQSADPIRCWWRTSASAVRVGEPFSLVLTCAVLENDTIKVVPDESRLDQSVMQLPPFEVVGGSHPADLRTDERRFFQYQYTLRVINERLFGRDVELPGLQITYRVQSRVDQGASIQGRDRTYILPTESVRVLSVVPTDAADIRDAPAETFGDIEARAFRANTLVVAAGVLFTLGALVLILAAAQVLQRYRGPAPVTGRLIPDRVILRGVGRELSAVQRECQQDGWTHELAGRALAAFRIAGGYALSRRISQAPAGAAANGHEGQLMVRGGWLGGKKVLVSGSITAEAVAQELARIKPGDRRALLELLQTGLTRFTAVWYGRDTSLVDAALDESLASGLDLLRRLKFENAWVVKQFTAVVQSSRELGSRVWSR